MPWHLILCSRRHRALMFHLRKGNSMLQAFTKELVLLLGSHPIGRLGINNARQVGDLLEVATPSLHWHNTTHARAFCRRPPNAGLVIKSFHCPPNPPETEMVAELKRTALKIDDVPGAAIDASQRYQYATISLSICNERFRKSINRRIHAVGQKHVRRMRNSATEWSPQPDISPCHLHQ